MMRFRFRLDPILRLRRAALDVALADLARERAHSERARAEARVVEARGVAAAVELEARSRVGLRAGELSARRSALAHQIGLRQRAQQALREAIARAARAREAVADARTQVRALEVLREQALDEHRREGLRREQNSLDEMAGQRRARTARRGPAGANAAPALGGGR